MNSVIVMVVGAAVSVGQVGIQGDANGDGIVNGEDMNAVLAHWLETGAAWAEHECPVLEPEPGGGGEEPEEPEVVGPPEPGGGSVSLEGAVVYTLSPWTIEGEANGTNRCAVVVLGEVEEIAAALGIRRGGVRWFGWAEEEGGGGGEALGNRH